MQNFTANLPHMIMATVVIAAAVVLAALHIITGGESITLIGGAGGFTLGAAAGSVSGSSAAPTVQATSRSNGETQLTVTPSSSTPDAPIGTGS